MTEILKCGCGELVEEKGWINPADKLPARNQRVIVCRMYDADTPIVEQATYEQDNEWWKVFGTRVKTKNIVAWMPMPEPPKEVQA